VSIDIEVQLKGLENGIVYSNELLVKARFQNLVFNAHRRQ
jgi:hypothetical protein